MSYHPAMFRRPRPPRIDHRASARERGYTAAWERLRKAYLNQHPLCVQCGAGGTDVDHILPLRDGGDNREANLQTLCHVCHSRKSQQDYRKRRRNQ